MKCNEHFAYFEGWGKEYFAFSVGRESMDDVIQYIRIRKTTIWATMDSMLRFKSFVHGMESSSKKLD